jgi:hypothetical protein
MCVCVCVCIPCLHVLFWHLKHTCIRTHTHTHVHAYIRQAEEPSQEEINFKMDIKNTNRIFGGYSYDKSMYKGRPLTDKEKKEKELRYVCMHVCICMYMYVSRTAVDRQRKEREGITVCVYACICMYMYVLCMRIYIYIYIYICMYVCMYVWNNIRSSHTYIHTYTYIYIYIYTRMHSTYIHACIHTYIYTAVVRSRECHSRGWEVGDVIPGDEKSGMSFPGMRSRGCHSCV